MSACPAIFGVHIAVGGADLEVDAARRTSCFVGTVALACCANARLFLVQTAVVARTAVRVVVLEICAVTSAFVCRQAGAGTVHASVK